MTFLHHDQRPASASLLLYSYELNVNKYLFLNSRFAHLLATRSLRSAEALSRRDLGMQVVHDGLFCDLTRLLHLESLFQLEASFSTAHLQNSSLHKRVHHSVLDRLVSCRGRACIEEQDGTLLDAVVGVGEAIECESRFGRRNDL